MDQHDLALTRACVNCFGQSRYARPVRAPRMAKKIKATMAVAAAVLPKYAARARPKSGMSTAKRLGFSERGQSL